MSKEDSQTSIRKISSKKLTFLILCTFLICHSYIYSQVRYLMKDDVGFDFILNVTTDGNTISGFTRERALLDYTSWFNYRLVRLATPLRNAEIIRFRATLVDGSFEGTYYNLFSSFRVVGNISADSIFYSLFDGNNELRRSFRGSKITDDHARRDYVQLVEEAIRITEENIFDPQIIQSRRWQQFRRRWLAAAPNIADDLEFQVGFFALARNIGFSHFFIVRDIASTNIDREKPSLTEIDENTVLLRISSFSERAENIKPLLDTIRQRAYSNLIIDLRGNGGGSFEPTFLVGNFLTDREFINGFFPSRNWYKEHNRPPNRNDLDKFSLMMSDDLSAIHSEYGFYIAATGSNDSFKGKIYILVNNRTGSAAEALVIGAKEHGLATIVGQRTAGALLSPQQFRIDEDIILVVPVWDFISYNGFRVDQQGIEPDIRTRRGQELERVLEIINRNN